MKTRSRNSLLQAELFPDSKILKISFSSPENKNAFGSECAGQLAKIQRKYSKQDIRAVCLQPVGPYFCSGGNLSESKALITRSSSARAETLAKHKKIAQTLNAFANWPVFKVAYVQGDCFGGGLEVLSCFNYVIANPNAFFGFWQQRMGLSTGWLGFGRWAERVETGRLRQDLLLGHTFSAETALRSGYCDKLMNEETFEAFLAEFMAGNSMPDPNFIKSMQKMTAKNEVQIFSHLWGSPRHIGALKGFFNS